MPDLQYAQGKTALHRACEEVTLLALYRADSCPRSPGTEQPLMCAGTRKNRGNLGGRWSKHTAVCSKLF